jgi:DNA-binding CsgD family transcriptional regulator
VGPLTVADILHFWLTLHGDAPVGGSVRSVRGSEVSFAGWLGLLGAVRALTADYGQGHRHGDLPRRLEVAVHDRARHLQALDGGDPQCQVEPHAQAERGGCRSVPDDLEGCVAAAGGDLAGAVVALEGLLGAVAPPVAPFERARILLALGRVRRRAKQWAQAREALAQALQIFEQTGLPDWAETTRAEFGRCGVRAADGELTPSEQQVAELVAQGLSNREIAAAAFISPKTVEANLARIYRKLGIRSRAQLGVHIASRAVGAAGTP